MYTDDFKRNNLDDADDYDNDNDNNGNNDNLDLFKGGDFVFTKTVDPETGDSVIMGGGYKVNSFFMQSGIPVVTTFNQMDDELQNEDKQSGGKNKGKDKVSSPFENLAVPAGLFYINQRTFSASKQPSPLEPFYKTHTPISDDMIDKLFGLVEMDKKRKRKTKKQTNKKLNKKTRRH